MSKNGYDNSTTDIYHGRSRNKESNPISSTSSTSTTRSRHRDAVSADKKPSKSKSKSARSPGDYGPGYGWPQAPLLIPQDIDADTELETSDIENEFVKSITGRNRSREHRSSPWGRDRNISTSRSNTDASSRSKRTFPLYSEGSDPRIRSDRKPRPSSRTSATSRGIKSSRSVTGDYHSSNFESSDGQSRVRLKKVSRSSQSDDGKKSHKSTNNNSTKSRSSVEQTFQEAVRVKLSRPATNDVRTVPGKRDVVIDRARGYRAEIEQEVIFDATTDWEGPKAGAGAGAGSSALKKEHSSSSSYSQLQNNRYQNPSITARTGTSTSTTTVETKHPGSSIRRKRVGGPEDPTFMPARKPVANPKDIPTLPTLPSRESQRIPSRSNIQPREVKLGSSRDRDRVPSGTEEWGNPFDRYGLPEKEKEKGKEKEKEKKNRLKNMKISEKLGRALRGFGRRSREDDKYI